MDLEKEKYLKIAFFAMIVVGLMNKVFNKVSD
jgi:hypothetical protein